jgi:hypothetical protein
LARFGIVFNPDKRDGEGATALPDERDALTGEGAQGLACFLTDASERQLGRVEGRRGVAGGEGEVLTEAAEVGLDDFTPRLEPLEAARGLSG